MDAALVRILRKAVRITATYASKQLGGEPFTNVQVLRRSGSVPLSLTVLRRKFVLLGHVLRREMGDPSRAPAFDRFGTLQCLRGPSRPGRPRPRWSVVVLGEAIKALREQVLLVRASGEEYNPNK